MSTSQFRRQARLLLAALFLASIFIAPATYAQSPANGSAHAETSATANHEPANGESEEDELAQFKHSRSVRWVAKVTGLRPHSAYWLCVLLNFAVIAGTIFYFSKKHLPSLFRNRTAAIQKAMQEARQASEEANRRLAEIENRLSRLGAEIAGMNAAGEKEAAAEELRIKAAAEEDARKIVESAESEIAAAAKLARRELTAYAANLAVSLAARQIKVDTATDQALVRGFANQLSPKTKTGQDGN